MIPSFSTDFIELEVTANEPTTIRHGLGRQVLGWSVLWADAFIQFRVKDPGADTSKELVLIPNVSGNARLVLI